MLSRFEELTELIENVKKNNEFNLENIIQEELDEFKVVTYKYRDFLFNSLDEVDINDNISRREVKMLEDVIQETSDVIVVISQLDGNFDDNLIAKLIEYYDPETSQTLYNRFQSMVDEFHDSIMFTAVYKCERTIFRQERFNYYG